MRGNDEVEGRELLAHVLLPVAHEEDVLATGTELEPHRSEPVTARRVVEKAGGAPDETPVEQSEELADESYTTVRTVSPDVDKHTAHTRDIGGAIVGAVDEDGASTIAYRSRGGNRITQFLSGGRSPKPIAGGDRPVITIPCVDSGR